MNLGATKDAQNVIHRQDMKETLIFASKAISPLRWQIGTLYAIIFQNTTHCILSASITYTVNRYKISLYGTDGTCELEFRLFDERGTSLIGKTADRLIRQNNRSELPPEISAIVGEKLTVVVKVFPAKSIHKRGPNKDNKDPTFDILSIKKRHGKDLLLSMFKNEEATSLLGTSSSQNPKLPPLEPIEQTNEEIKVQLSSQISLP